MDPRERLYKFHLLSLSPPPPLLLPPSPPLPLLFSRVSQPVSLDRVPLGRLGEEPFPATETPAPGNCLDFDPWRRKIEGSVGGPERERSLFFLSPRRGLLLGNRTKGTKKRRNGETNTSFVFLLPPPCFERATIDPSPSLFAPSLAPPSAATDVPRHVPPPSPLFLLAPRT